MSDSTMTINKWGTKHWKNSAGQYHRTGGPALEWVDGDKEWYVNGKRHRTDGPAVEWANGVKEWYVNGKFLGLNDRGFWARWERLTPEQKKNPVLLTYLPGEILNV